MQQRGCQAEPRDDLPERSQRKHGHTHLTSILLSQAWKNSCERNEVCGQVKNGSYVQVSHCH